MSKSAFCGALSAQEIFFYPDMELGALPEQLHIDLPLGGKPGIQLLLQTHGDAARLTLEGSGFTAEYYAMRDVPVEYNTGDGTQQGGAMVLEQRPAQKPDYASRLAPFRVYDCLIDAPDGRIDVQNDRLAAYICLRADAQCRPGTYLLTLCAGCAEGEYRCALEVRVYDVRLPEDTFPVTNWFSLDAISRLHRVTDGTPEYYAMVRRYARAMRRTHQTLFYLDFDGEKCVCSRQPLEFTFDYLKPLIECFLSEGMQTIELGPLLSRGSLPNGMPDMYTDTFKCIFAPELAVDCPEGYAQMSRFVAELAAFLRENGWEKRVVFHIHDEPDVHYRDARTLDERRRQYLLTANILRRHLPQVRVIEAVDSAAFRGGVDIWVPVTSAFERSREEFARLIALGEQVWTYVCCTPEGHWLNRFLDQPLLHGRLLFWGCAANRIGGYLHWGFNQFPEGMDPFQGTSCPNHTGIGTNFPCGDCFLVYPGADGPLLSMRLEASRRGAEDAALLAMLRECGEAAHDALIARVFTNNSTYDDDPAAFADSYARLLALLEQSAGTDGRKEK